jgi:alkanesulfonate monooxygenase SsuD/methylene tetrahydromethanopterin reductase-like flavin-dependent oxidoreductase (luciferase family)
LTFGYLEFLQMPKPWGPDAEHRAWKEGLDRVECADRVGLDHFWEVEHHFLEEYAGSSASESFLAAASQRTKRIRLGSGVTLVAPPYNHPARVAERVAALDLMSDGRAEFGTGESTAFAELDAFHLTRTDKRAMWREALPVICRMMVETPFRGYQGKYFSMPPRNVVPKPLQKPHPPVWMAVSRQETILLAATYGLGVLSFGFLSHVEAGHWTHQYYEALKECRPLTYRVNPNVAFLSFLMCKSDGEKAVERGRANEGFFTFLSKHHYVDGHHQPGATDLWEQYQGLSQKHKDVFHSNFTSCFGTPDEIRKVLLAYEEAGVDQIMFILQYGALHNDEVLESLELFGKTVLPEFREREERAARIKAQRLEPIIEAAVKRRIELPANWYPQDYSYDADGALVAHYGFGGDAKQKAAKRDS